MQNDKYVILCVDDDPDIIESAKTILEANGYIFVGAATAEEGLRKYAESAPDLIIVDLMMEEVDSGTGFVKDLKAKGCSVPIYMLTSVGDAMSSNVDASSLGLSGVFQKPLKPQVLLSMLSTKLK